MLEGKTFYRVKCDRCADWFSTNGSDFDYSVFESGADALNTAGDCDWLIGEGEHEGKALCDNCRPAPTGQTDEEDEAIASSAFAALALADNEPPMACIHSYPTKVKDGRCVECGGTRDPRHALADNE